jgi:CelD/BcsL family acetyltransferase involved in cellulose biosynthesis
VINPQASQYRSLWPLADGNSPATEARLEVTRVTNERGFDELRSDWNGVVDRMDGASPFQSWEWNRVWWKHFGGRDQLEILVFGGDGRVEGIAPYYRRHHGPGRWGLSSLVPIGGGHDQKHGLTEQWELLFPNRSRAELFVALATWLRQSRWSAILIPGLSESDSLPDWLAGRVIAQGGLPHHSRQLPDTWDAFVGCLKKSMRDNVRYYPRLLRRHGHDYACEVASTPDAVRTSLPALLDLHRERAEWQSSRRHGDRFALPGRPEFIGEVAPLLAGRGELRIHLLTIGAERVAAEMWLERGETMFSYCSGYRPGWAKYSVAMVNSCEALKDGIRRGVRVLDLLAGVGQHKERWGTGPQARRWVIIGRHPVVVRVLGRTRDFHRRFRKMSHRGAA